jgi:hypothetical protein
MRQDEMSGMPMAMPAQVDRVRGQNRGMRTSSQAIQPPWWKQARGQQVHYRWSHRERADDDTRQLTFGTNAYDGGCA